MDAVFEDSTLLARYAAQRDAQAFAELVRRYADLVYATARRVTGDAAAAEDVSQDCFLRLAQRAGEISGSVAAWLHRASVNRSLELLRSNRARRVREAAVADQRNADENETAQQLIAHIDEAMQALPEEAQKLLTEHFLLGRSQADIAAQMQVNQSTVSRRMEQAVSELRERLRSEGVTVAAMGVLPMVLEQVREISAPAVVRGALNKIGLSGVTGTSAGAGAVAGAKTISAGAALKLTAAGIVAVAGGALVVHLASRPFKPAAAGAGAAAATQPATRAARAARAERGDRFELDDILDRDEQHDEPDDAGGKK